MKTTVNVIFPSDRLVDGKLWPHYVKSYLKEPKINHWCATDGDYAKYYEDSITYENNFKIAISQSIPFAKECVDEVFNELSKWYFKDDGIPDKLYSFEFDGEVKIEKYWSCTDPGGRDTLCSNGRDHCLNPCELRQVAILIPAQARKKTKKVLVFCPMYYRYIRTRRIN